VAGRGVGRIADALALKNCTVEMLNGDAYLHAWR
jgi:hypothetical protein